jgi:hypothetical protein
MHLCKKRWNRVNAVLHYAQLHMASLVIIKRRRSDEKYDPADWI